MRLAQNTVAEPASQRFVQDKMKEMGISIAAVERDVGLSKDVLRVWERRYGFPTPGRDANGDRIYPPEQVRRLRLIKRLTDQGHRPGQLLTWPIADLEEALTPQHDAPLSPASARGTGAMEPLMAHLRRHDAPGFLHLLQQRLAVEGLGRFVQDTVAPLSVHVGLDWESGRLEVFEEHLFTDLTTRLLRQAIATVPAGSEPRVLLTTPSTEPHSLGLLMAEAVMALAGAHCLSLGTQTPIPEIVHAAEAHDVDVVALSFSSAFPKRQVDRVLQQLRGGLAGEVEIWVGGAGCSRGCSVAGVRAMSTLDEAAEAVRDWRAKAASRAGIQRG